MSLSSKFQQLWFLIHDPVDEFTAVIVSDNAKKYANTFWRFYFKE